MRMTVSGEATGATPCLTVTLRQEATVTTVGLAGELDLAAESALEETAEQLRTVGCREVVLDVDGLRFCDARGLGAILVFRRRMDEAGAWVTVRGADAAMVRLLRLTRLQQLLDLDEDLASAQ